MSSLLGMPVSFSLLHVNLGFSTDRSFVTEKDKTRLGLMRERTAGKHGS